MNLLPIEFISFILPFAVLLSKRTWDSGLVLLVGAILCTRKAQRQRRVAGNGLEQ